MDENEAEPTIGNPDQVDRAVTALAQFHRRCVLRYLIESPAETVSLDELITHLQGAAWTASPPSEAKLKRALHHNHLPRLETAGLITYDARTNEIRYVENDLIESLVETLPNDL